MSLFGVGGGAADIGGTVGGGTTGSVLFVGAGPVIAQDNTNFFWDDTNNFHGLMTAVPTHTLTLGSTATGSAYYNTVDQTTNYERARLYWTSNVFTLSTEKGGSGTLRNLGFNGNITQVSPSAGVDGATVYGITKAGGISVTLLASTGIQTWNIESAGTTFGQISYTTPGSKMGIGIWTGVALNQFNILNQATFFSLGFNSIGATLNITNSGTSNVGIGTAVTAPTATLHIRAGTATASSAPLKFTTGTLLTSAEAGAIEFLTDIYYATITTSAVRRVLVAAQTGRATAQTAAVASVAAFTLGATDATFEVSANVLVTTATAHSFTVTCAYTDEGNTARTLTLNFSTLAGVISNAAITNVAGAVPYEGVPTHIRCKASTAITIATTGTFTTVTYNVEGIIKQVA